MASIQDLEAQLEILGQEKRALLERIRVLSEERKRLLYEEHAAQWDLTPEEYTQAKVHARAEGRPLGVVLNEFRKRKNQAAREVQTTQVNVAAIGAHAQGV